jgi:hypothetical protein
VETFDICTELPVHDRSTLVTFGIGSFGVREAFSECRRREEVVHEPFGSLFAVPLYIDKLDLDVDEEEFVCRLSIGVVKASQ